MDEGRPAPVIEGVESLPETITNAFGMEFVLIRPGKYWRGSTAEEVHEAFEDAKKFFSDTTKLELFLIEMPRREIEITRPFWLGKHLVTQRQWREAVTGLRKVNLDLNGSPSRFLGDDLPVEQVSWSDCAELIGRLNASGEGFVYDFPTEAEWEYACRAGTTTPFWFGDLLTREQANYDGNFPYGSGTEGTYRNKTTPVGRFPPNSWGLHDMHGNVWEWCRDAFEPDFYRDAPARDPEGPKYGEFRVLRGGSWSLCAVFCRSAFRLRLELGPGEDTVGFRCAIRSVGSSRAV